MDHALRAAHRRYARRAGSRAGRHSARCLRDLTQVVAARFSDSRLSARPFGLPRWPRPADGAGGSVLPCARTGPLVA